MATYTHCNSATITYQDQEIVVVATHEKSHALYGNRVHLSWWMHRGDPSRLYYIEDHITFKHFDLAKGYIERFSKVVAWEYVDVYMKHLGPKEDVLTPDALNVLKPAR